MNAFTIVGYTYDADVHCVQCAVKRFGIYIDGKRDSEGNQPHPIFAGDEFDTDTTCDCGREIDTCYIGVICEYCGGHHFHSHCYQAYGNAEN